MSTSDSFTTFRDKEWGATDSDHDSDDSMSDDSPFSPIDVCSDTSYEGEPRSPSPTPSVVSVTSSFMEQAYRIEYGRGFNTYSDIYSLPADAEELARLDRQHMMFMAVMGKYCPLLPPLLADDGTEKAVLDLGCGSGAWIMDLAHDFPHVSCVAVDLVPMQCTEMPPNCRSEVDDINLGLEHFYGQFDVVHTRLISSGIRDYQGTINHIAHVLKPGGLVDLTEFDFTLHDRNRRLIEIDTNTVEAPWWPRWMAFLNRAATQRGADLNSAGKMRQWIIDHGAFEDVVYREFWIPASPWPKGDDPLTAWWRRIGELERADIICFLKAGRPLLLGNGLSESICDLLEENAKTELLNCDHECFVRVQNVYATRRRDPPPA